MFIRALYFISSKEIKKACQKKMPYDFTYFILICKLYKSGKPHRQKKKRQQSGGGGEPEILWSNPEEELINQVCICNKEFTKYAVFDLEWHRNLILQGITNCKNQGMMVMYCIICRTCCKIKLILSVQVVLSLSVYVSLIWNPVIMVFTRTTTGPVSSRSMYY